MRRRVLINVTITLFFRFVVIMHIGIRVAVTDAMMDCMTLSWVVAKSSCDASGARRCGRRWAPKPAIGPV